MSETSVKKAQAAVGSKKPGKPPVGGRVVERPLKESVDVKAEAEEAEAEKPQLTPEAKAAMPSKPPSQQMPKMMVHPSEYTGIHVWRVGMEKNMTFMITRECARELFMRTHKVDPEATYEFDMFVNPVGTPDNPMPSANRMLIRMTGISGIAFDADPKSREVVMGAPGIPAAV